MFFRNSVNVLVNNPFAVTRYFRSAAENKGEADQVEEHSESIHALFLMLLNLQCDGAHCSRGLPGKLSGAFFLVFSETASEILDLGTVKFGGVNQHRINNFIPLLSLYAPYIPVGCFSEQILLVHARKTEGLDFVSVWH